MMQLTGRAWGYEMSPTNRPIFEHFSPRILLGLTATPERMDGKSVAADFNNRFAAEIRLPEALEEKLLCPFHCFGVADPVYLDLDWFWRNGKYDAGALENVYTGADVLARQRVDAVQEAPLRYEPESSKVKGIGFCVTVKHARYMAQMFNDYEPELLLVKETWTGWKAKARLSPFSGGGPFLQAGEWRGFRPWW
jgi:superfamily II DNA or RNA helicase